MCIRDSTSNNNRNNRSFFHHKSNESLQSRSYMSHSVYMEGSVASTPVQPAVITPACYPWYLFLQAESTRLLETTQLKFIMLPVIEPGICRLAARNHTLWSTEPLLFIFTLLCRNELVIFHVFKFNAMF